jgi:hypothetical protein
MALRCPTWIRWICAVGFIGFDSCFRWDTLGGPDLFHDWFDYRITDKESAPYHSSILEPS